VSPPFVACQAIGRNWSNPYFVTAKRATLRYVFNFGGGKVGCCSLTPSSEVAPRSCDILRHLRMGAFSHHHVRSQLYGDEIMRCGPRLTLKGLQFFSEKSASGLRTLGLDLPQHEQIGLAVRTDDF
jgi:hypothetical protein